MSFVNIVKDKMPDLSKGQKKTAVYLVNHLEESSYATLSTLSQEIGVSETTIIRFAFSLGFDSFSKMQKEIRREILGTSAEVQEEEEKDFFKSIIRKEMTCLEQLGGQLDEKKTEWAAEQIWQADFVLTTGARGALGPVMWLANTLSHFRSNVRFVRPYVEEGISNLADVTKNSVVICVSLARYAKGSILTAQMAKDRGACVIAITDSPVSPIALIADEFFLVEPLKNDLGFNSFVSVLCMENLLISAIIRKHQEELSKRIAKYEALYAETDIFYE